MDPFASLGFKAVTPKSYAANANDPFASLGFKPQDAGTPAPASAPGTPTPVVTADKTYDVPAVPFDSKKAIANARVEAETAKANADKANSASGMIGNFGKALVENIAPSEVGLGRTIGKIGGNQSEKYSTLIQDQSAQQNDLRKHIAEQDKLGRDTTKLKQLYNDGVKNIQDLAQKLADEQNLPSWKEAVGQLGGTALDVLTAGTYGKAAAAMKSGELALKSAAPTVISEARKILESPIKSIFSKAGVKAAAEGAGIGYGYDVTQNLQNNAESPLTPGLGTAIGAAIPFASKAEGAIKNSLSKPNAVNELEQTYENLMSGTTAGKKKLDKLGSKTDALNNAGTEGRTPARVLAENGVIPERQGAKLDTYDQASRFKETVGPLRDANRQALAEVGLSTQPVPLADLEKNAVAAVRSTRNVDAGIADNLEKQIHTEFDKLRSAYGDAIPLSKVDEIKSARWDEVFKNKSLVDADKLKKDSDYAIAKAMQKTIEHVAAGAGHVEVAQLNREIGDRLEAAKFLEDLNGKTVKGGRLLKYVTTLIGSEIGGTTIPGKIIGAIGGNTVGNLIISNTIASPLKRIILRNLETRDPAAYTKTLEWLKKQNLDRETRLLLPPASFIPAEGTKDPTKYLGRTGDVPNQSKSPANQQTTKAMSTPIIDKSIPEKSAQVIPNSKKKDIPNKQGGFISVPFKDSGDLTTKIVSKLEGKTSVSKQFISDLTNSGDVRQPERDLIRQILSDYPEGKDISVKEFADKVKTELLPLDRTNPRKEGFQPKYENIALSDNLRGDVKNYKEHVYESPIKTSAGDVHFATQKHGNYFAHTRVEDMADGKTRRVIEAQSDLFQKGRLEGEKLPMGEAQNYTREYMNKRIGEMKVELANAKTPKEKKFFEGGIKSFEKTLADKYAPREAEIAKLEPYRNTWHERIIREEIQQAAKDGKTKLQFPTGETAMNIEGLVNRTDKWVTLDNKLVDGKNIKDGDLITYQTHEGTPHEDRRFLITKNNGDGTFRAVDSMTAENDSGLHELLDKKNLLDDGRMPSLQELHDVGTTGNKEVMDYLNKIAEQLSAKDTVDTNNPIYKFYEKDVQKFLNKLGAKKIVDDKGVSWIELPIDPKMAKQPVQAYGKASLGALLPVAGATGLGAVTAATASKPSKTTTVKNPDFKPAEQKPTEFSIPDRKVSVTEDDLSEAEKILFSELSNKGSEASRKDEARKILNTAINRVVQSKGKSLKDILTTGEYQGLGTKQYDLASSTSLDAPSKAKLELIRSVLEEVRQGKLKDNANGSVFYKHDKTGNLALGGKRLFK